MKFLILLAVLPLLAQAEYTKLEWTDCGSREVNIKTLTMTPMPILTPGKATFTYKADHKRTLVGNLNTEIKITRSVNGLNLPIRCYLAAGVNVGSCTYNDLCSIVKTLLPDNFDPNKCLPSLADFGIDCTCPFKLRQGEINIDKVIMDLSDAASSPIFSFLASGDFDITVKAKDTKGPIACVNVKFSVKPNK